jgi:hypothetical protein
MAGIFRPRCPEIPDQRGSNIPAILLMPKLISEILLRDWLGKIKPDQKQGGLVRHDWARTVRQFI